jgi:hypothetical protein
VVVDCGGNSSIGGDGVMSDAVQIALIGALAGIPSTIGGIAAAYFSYKASQHSREAVNVSRETRANTNGMKDQLVALTKKSSYAEGKLAGESGERG